MREPRPPEAHELPEAETIQLARRGDAAAFESIYRSHCARVFALCTRMLKNAAEAEDLTQEIFLHVFRKIHSFRRESAFSTWLYRVSVNMVLMRLRRMTFAKTSLDDIAEAGETTGASQRELGGPDLHLEGYIDRTTLQKAVDQLPPRFKAMFVLYDVQGYAHREIAKILGCSLGTSKSQLHKARRRLRELLCTDRKFGSWDKHRSIHHAARGIRPAFLRAAGECESD